jgi:hypothetical protein
MTADMIFLISVVPVGVLVAAILSRWASNRIKDDWTDKIKD